jgi:organic hydroperoxide reductase OsmC/OhrA
MNDLAIRLRNQPGALAQLGETLGKARVSIEGGGGFVLDGQAVVHFLFDDSRAARSALAAAGIEVVDDREVLAVRLDQETPGQLGSLTRALGEAGVNIEVVYSDHQNQLILVVDNPAAGAEAIARWKNAPRPSSTRREHHYRTHVRWTGDSGTGTSGYKAFRRDHVIDAAGKPQILGSSDPQFLGDPARWNPEELLVASLSACHQLWYLHLCADAGVIVTSYEDRAEGKMVESTNGTARFSRVILRPTVRIRPGSDAALATTLHVKAHELCFIARSVAFAVECEPTILVADDIARIG